MEYKYGCDDTTFNYIFNIQYAPPAYIYIYIYYNDIITLVSEKNDKLYGVNLMQCFRFQLQKCSYVQHFDFLNFIKRNTNHFQCSFNILVIIKENFC